MIAGCCLFNARKRIGVRLRKGGRDFEVGKVKYYVYIYFLKGGGWRGELGFRLFLYFFEKGDLSL